MRNFFKNNAKIKVLLGIFVLIILIQAALLTTLYRSQDNKDFEVNLVQIKTEKDSVDFLKMKNDLVLMDQTVGQLHSFLASKNIVDARIETLNQDSLLTKTVLLSVPKMW